MKEKLEVGAIAISVIPLVGVLAGLLLLKHKPRNARTMIAVGVASFVCIQVLVRL